MSLVLNASKPDQSAAGSYNEGLLDLETELFSLVQGGSERYFSSLVLSTS